MIDGLEKGSHDNRTHVINFRLSPSEYEAVCAAARAAGARSLSSFARISVLSWVKTYNASSGTPEDDLQAVQTRYTEFDATFRKFLRRKAGEQDKTTIKDLEA